MKLPEIIILLNGNWKTKLPSKETSPRLVLTYELEYHPSAWGYTVVNREKLPVPENTVTFNRVGDIRHLIAEKEEVESQFVYFGIVSDPSEVLTQAVNRIPYVSLASEEFKLKWEQFQQLCSRREEAETEMRATLLLLDLLFLLAAGPDSKTESDAFSSLHRKSLMQAICYMKANLNRNCSLREIAAQTGYSVSHFNYLFRSYTRKSPHEYYRSLKIQEAKVQLLTTTKKVGEIAEALSFRSVSDFSAAFKTECGVTPTRFRKTYD